MIRMQVKDSICFLHEILTQGGALVLWKGNRQPDADRVATGGSGSDTVTFTCTYLNLIQTKNMKNIERRSVTVSSKEDKHCKKS